MLDFRVVCVANQKGEIEVKGRYYKNGLVSQQRVEDGLILNVLLQAAAFIGSNDLPGPTLSQIQRVNGGEEAEAILRGDGQPHAT